MGGIVDHAQTMFPGDGLNRTDIAGIPIHMNSENGFHLRRDGGLNKRRINTKVAGIYVDKNRLAVFPQNRPRRSDIGERRSNNLAFNSQRLDGDLQSNSPIGGNEKMFNPEVFLEFLLQLLEQRTIVGHLPGSPYLFQLLDIFFKRRQVRLCDIDHDGFHTIYRTLWCVIPARSNVPAPKKSTPNWSTTKPESESRLKKSFFEYRRT